MNKEKLSLHWFGKDFIKLSKAEKQKIRQLLKKLKSVGNVSVLHKQDIAAKK